MIDFIYNIMSIRLKVLDDRLILDLKHASAHIEIPLYHGNVEPLFIDFLPGIPVHIEQDTTSQVMLYDQWLIVDEIPLMPIGPQGSLGDGITVIAKRYNDSPERDNDAFPAEVAFDDVPCKHEIRQTIG